MNSPQTDNRLAEIHAWLASLPRELGLDPATLTPVTGDASFRRYFRLQAARGTLIVMDAPPPHEDVRPFVHVAGLLAASGVRVPDILAQSPDQGLLLLSDLGGLNYTQRIRQGVDEATLQHMQRGALQSLLRVQQSAPTGLAAYDSARLREELELFPQWFVKVHHQTELDDATRQSLHQMFDLLSNANGKQPGVLVHRDYHSPNLMFNPDGEPGVIDFQDALYGPITYDLASLVTDARTTIEEPQQLDMAIRYWEMARRAGLPVDHDFADFHRAYEWMSLQRNLRILGVFARLTHRDQRDNYLEHMPRMNAYVRQVAQRYGVFAPLVRLLDRLDKRETTVGYTF
ncbi:aminoglycoside phosphotransferase family protein [Bordetella trematum]|uniref:aminoglycoside phosphotransferase family protein n=1 Tax=Bordetella trematum TaxID=123899 RepID=UPI000470F244|nr:phosphotransferase [Bordetella trematum]